MLAIKADRLTEDTACRVCYGTENIAGKRDILISRNAPFLIECNIKNFSQEQIGSPSNL